MITLEQPPAERLEEILEVLRTWQVEGAPVPLHPGDVGWYASRGPEATASALRCWRRGGRLTAVGLLDGPGLIRLAIDPDAQRDEALADQIADDVSRVERGVLPAGTVSVEVRSGARLRARLIDHGWEPGESWTPLSRDLTAPVDDPGVRVEVVGPARVADHTAVHRSAFASPRFTDERWHTMAAGPGFGDARSLVAYDDQGAAVAEVTVWSAGPGRPGLLEPMGVHADHRRRGHGVAICLAAAAALRELGASSATVCTPSANVGGVATYLAAGYRARPRSTDLSRRA